MVDFITEHQEMLAQIVGFLAIIVAMIGYQFNTHKKLMIFLIVTSLLWCGHYLLLGSVTAIAMDLVNAIRSIIYSFKDKKWAQSKSIPIIFIIISIVLGIISWESPWSILPIIAVILLTIANWQSNTKTLRLLTMPVNICWFIFNVVVNSWAGMLYESVVFLSVLVATVRYDVLKRTNNKSDL